MTDKGFVTADLQEWQKKKPWTPRRIRVEVSIHGSIWELHELHCLFIELKLDWLYVSDFTLRELEDGRGGITQDHFLAYLKKLTPQHIFVMQMKKTRYLETEHPIDIQGRDFHYIDHKLWNRKIR